MPELSFELCCSLSVMPMTIVILNAVIYIDHSIFIVLLLAYIVCAIAGIPRVYLSICITERFFLQYPKYIHHHAKCTSNYSLIIHISFIIELYLLLFFEFK